MPSYRASVNKNEMEVDEIIMPPEWDELCRQIEFPKISGLPALGQREEKDLFSIQQRKAWDKSIEARCDFQYRLRLTRRADTCFVTIWQKSVFGRTLTDIKADDNMVPFFADNITPVIQEMVGYHLNDGSWAIVTTPMRRHTTHNFASLIAQRIAEALKIPFYFDCARCRTKQRVGAVFDANNIPRQQNIIVFDDFVTTGSTLLAMKNLLLQLGKNCCFFAGINNAM